MTRGTQPVPALLPILVAAAATRSNGGARRYVGSVSSHLEPKGIAIAHDAPGGRAGKVRADYQGRLPGEVAEHLQAGARGGCLSLRRLTRDRVEKPPAGGFATSWRVTRFAG